MIIIKMEHKLTLEMYTVTLRMLRQCDFYFLIWINEINQILYQILSE